MPSSIRPKQPVLIAALPMPLDGISLMCEFVERVYGTGDSMLDMSDGNSVRILAPADGFGPLKARKPKTPLRVDTGARINEIKLDGENASITLEDAEERILIFADSLRVWFGLKGGINYVTAHLHSPGDTQPDYYMTVQKAGNPTAHDLRQTAEARVAVLEQQIRDLGAEPA